jgi:hypothetical protein
MDNLRHVCTMSLLHTLAERTVANNNADIPLSLIDLAGAIACVLGIEQRFLLAERLRDVADMMEKEYP